MCDLRYVDGNVTFMTGNFVYKLLLYVSNLIIMIFLLLSQFFFFEVVVHISEFTIEVDKLWFIDVYRVLIEDAAKIYDVKYLNYYIRSK